MKVFKEKWVLPLDKAELICYNFIIANAPLAQLVKQLTLNQWVLGSSPRWCTNHGRPVGQAVKTPPSHGGITSSSLVRVTIFLLVGVYGKEVPPVPIPNTEVKLFYAYDT